MILGSAVMGFFEVLWGLLRVNISRTASATTTNETSGGIRIDIDQRIVDDDTATNVLAFLHFCELSLRWSRAKLYRRLYRQQA